LLKTYYFELIESRLFVLEFENQGFLQFLGLFNNLLSSKLTQCDLFGLVLILRQNGNIFKDLISEGVLGSSLPLLRL